jgi:histidyl-tRNA synthetase
MDSEWKNLPNGFRDFSAKEFLFFLEKSQAFIKIAEELDAEIVVTPPVGFLSTFRHRINTAGDKIFEFKDKKNRELVLSPDSSPHVVRWFLAKNNPTLKKRILFVSPVFRYRNIKERCWIQFGFASFNAKEFEREQCVLAGAYLKTLIKLKIPSIIQLGDFSIHRNILKKYGLSESEVDEFLHLLRSCSLEDQLKITKSRLNGGTSLDFMKLLQLKFTNKPKTQFNFYDKEIEHKVLRLVDWGKDIVENFPVSIDYVFNDFHASELQNGLVIKFKKLSKGHFADGGDYTFYGGGLLDAQDFITS